MHAQHFSDIRKAFHFVDVDNSGTIDAGELKRALKLFNYDIPKDRLDALMKDCDSDGNGKISYAEFTDALARDTVALAAMGKRGMQAKEAMGVDAYESIDAAIHGQKIQHAYSMKHGPRGGTAPAVGATTSPRAQQRRSQQQQAALDAELNAMRASLSPRIPLLGDSTRRNSPRYYKWGDLRPDRPRAPGTPRMTPSMSPRELTPCRDVSSAGGGGGSASARGVPLASPRQSRVNYRAPLGPWSWDEGSAGLMETSSQAAYGPKPPMALEPPPFGPHFSRYGFSSRAISANAAAALSDGWKPPASARHGAVVDRAMEAAETQEPKLRAARHIRALESAVRHERRRHDQAQAAVWAQLRLAATPEGWRCVTPRATLGTPMW